MGSDAYFNSFYGVTPPNLIIIIIIFLEQTLFQINNVQVSKDILVKFVKIKFSLNVN